MKQIVIGDGVVEWVAAHMKRGEGYGLSTGIGLTEHDELIAGVVYNEFNGVNINMHVAAIGRRWLTRQFLWTCFDYPFNQCKVKRITAFIEDENEDAIRFDEHLGFKYECRMTGAYVNGDILIYRMRREDCRWLELKKGHNHERFPKPTSATGLQRRGPSYGNWQFGEPASTNPS